MRRTEPASGHDYTLDTAPDYAEACIGWRTWRTVDHDGNVRLQSIIRPDVWPPYRELQATCQARFAIGTSPLGQHAAPGTTCGCGIYAVTSPALATRHLGYPTGTVLGRVALWGKVVECEHGWRASRAYPVHLYIPLLRWPPCLVADPDQVENLRQQLHEQYGVPVATIACRNRRQLATHLQNDEPGLNGEAMMQQTLRRPYATPTKQVLIAGYIAAIGLLFFVAIWTQLWLTQQNTSPMPGMAGESTDALEAMAVFLGITFAGIVAINAVAGGCLSLGWLRRTLSGTRVLLRTRGGATAQGP